MRRAFSLQRRLSIRLAAGVTVMWLAATTAAGFVVRHELDEAFDSALQETAQRLLSLAAVDILNREGAPAARRVATIGRHEEYLTYLVWDRAGNVLLHSHDADPAVFPRSAETGFRTTASHRIYGESAISDTLHIEVAEPLEHRREAAMESVVALVLPLAVLIPLSLVGVWWFVRRSLRPVIDLRTQIEVRGAGDLTPVAAGGLPGEIGPIADAVNRLMDRLRHALEAERSFTANSAHELRTPIAGALAQTQRLLAELPQGELSDHAARIEDSLHHLARMSEKLMQLARAEGGSLLAETPQDLGPVLALIVDEFRRDGGDGARLRFTASPNGQLRSRMDPDAFAVLMRNLIENALKHSPAGSPVEVSLSEGTLVRVVNGGPALSPDVLSRLRGRFERGPTTAAGSGLGLAIADMITSGTGTTLELLSPAGGRTDGFEARLTIGKPVPVAKSTWRRNPPTGADITSRQQIITNCHRIEIVQ